MATYVEFSHLGERALPGLWPPPAPGCPQLRTGRGGRRGRGRRSAQTATSPRKKINI